MTIKKTALQLGYFSALFITTSTAPFLGIKVVSTFSYLILIMTLIYEVFTRHELFTIQRFNIELKIITIFILYALFKSVDNDWDSIKTSFFFIVIPVLISILIKIQTTGTKKSLSKIIILFFFVECTLAIYEKINGINLFPYTNELENTYIDTAEWAFRSTSLLGHPLNNALCTSIILSFILVSRYSKKFKIFSLIMAILALLSFNARGAILSWLLLGTYFFYHLYLQQGGGRKQLNRFFLIVVAITIFTFIIYLITETSLGGRLANKEKIFDGSAQTRIDVLSSFQYIIGYDFWLGNPKNYLPITFKLGAAGVENSYVVLIINYGILFGIPLIIALYCLIRKYLLNFNLSQKVIIISSFILVGSLNNSLAGVTPWVFFYLCVHIFPCIGVPRIRPMRVFATENNIKS